MGVKGENEHIDMLRGSVQNWTRAYRYGVVCGGIHIDMEVGLGLSRGLSISICSCCAQQSISICAGQGGSPGLFVGVKKGTSSFSPPFSFHPILISSPSLQTLTSLSLKSLNPNGFSRNVLHEHCSTSPPLRIDSHGSSLTGKNLASPFLDLKFVISPLDG